VVGLGNPGDEYRETRHNIGQRVVDHLARTLKRGWQREGQALLARAAWRGEPLSLVKPLTFMNVSGPVVAATLRRLGADATDLMLVHDDIDLPLGTVRVRMRGSHGGHNGVRSVLEALGTAEVRRVKLGIGRPDRRDDVADHVLSAFDPDEQDTVATTVAAAADRVLLLAQTPSTR